MEKRRHSVARRCRWRESHYRSDAEAAHHDRMERARGAHAGEDEQWNVQGWIDYAGGDRNSNVGSELIAIMSAERQLLGEKDVLKKICYSPSCPTFG